MNVGEKPFFLFSNHGGLAVLGRKNKVIQELSVSCHRKVEYVEK